MSWSKKVKKTTLNKEKRPGYTTRIPVVLLEYLLHQSGIGMSESGISIPAWISLTQSCK
jgi:hypothetical protein